MSHSQKQFQGIEPLNSESIKKIEDALSAIGVDPTKTKSSWEYGARYGTRHGDISLMVCLHHDGQSNREYLWAEAGLGTVGSSSEELMLWLINRTRTMLMPFRFVISLDPTTKERTLVLQCRLLLEGINSYYLEELLSALVGIGSDLKRELLSFNLGFSDFHKH